MIFTNVAQPLLLWATRAEVSRASEQESTAPASHGTDPSEALTWVSDGEPRVCGYCGQRDPRWNGTDGHGWDVHDGLPACPDCLWIEPWIEREAA